MLRDCVKPCSMTSVKGVTYCMSDQRECKICLWTGQGNFCETLTAASVPIDAKWPMLILYLRGVREISFLSEVQKAAMQELLIKLLQEKDFSDNRYQEAQLRVFNILTSSYTDKLQEIARETSELAKDVHALFGKHTRQVNSVASSVDENMAKGVEPAALLSTLRDALKGVVAKMEEDANTLATLSHKDSLTGLANRRSFDAYLDDAVSKWVEHRTSVALIMFDIDNFKNFNDTYGHLVGDQVLRTLAAQMRKTVIPLDENKGNALTARYGGEEFAVVLLGPLADRAVEIGELIRKTLHKTTLKLRDAKGDVLQSGLKVTVSVGVACMWEGWQGVYQTNLVDCADKALYHAKRNGKNCTVHFVPDSKEGYIRVNEQ